MRYSIAAMATKNAIYLDNNATTRPDPQVVETMLPLWTEHWGNPGSSHRLGAEAARSVSWARHRVAEILGGSASELVFTSSGTEADNLALRGVVYAASRRCHVVTSAVEHEAVMETFLDLECMGLCELSVVGVDARGQLDLDQLDSALRPGETALVSTMWANNETGVLFPIEEIGRRAHAAGALFHVDAVQVAGKLPLDLRHMPVDMLALSAHKFHGPKGSGVLFVRGGVKLAPVLTGGGQERGRRSGTENPAAMAGLARALELAEETRPEAAPRMQTLRDNLAQGLCERVEGVNVSGMGVPRLANTLHLLIDGVEAEALLMLLDKEGVACSSGSACSTGALEPSHVLQAMGIEAARMHGALRISLSRDSTQEEMDRVLELLPPLVQRLRSLGSGTVERP